MIVFSSLKIVDVLSHGAAYLKEHDISSFHLDARLLLQHVLKRPAEFLICEPNHICADIEVQAYRQLLKRRARHEPVSKIVESKEFWGLPFRVNQDVLDPRPDSETLIESVRQNFPNRDSAYHILDLGVGSGCLLLALLHDYPQAMGVGVDICPAALEVARHNAHLLGLEQRAQWLCSSWGSGMAGQFDIIVSNPPYIPHGVISTLEAEVQHFEPWLALDGGRDGLDCYRQLASRVVRLLKPHGCLFIEIGQGQEDAVEALFISNGLKTHTWTKDIQGIKRCGIVTNVGNLLYSCSFRS